MTEDRTPETTTTATVHQATFDVLGWDERPIDGAPETPRLTQATTRYRYGGDVAGEGLSHYQLVYDAAGCADFVGVERLAATIAGRSGVLVLLHRGRFDGHTSRSDLEVVASEGALAGTSGKGQLVAIHEARYELTLTLTCAPQTPT